jgi:hypothetical protein
MRFEDISLRIRPRNPWEAMDLGIRMTQNWWQSVYSSWLLVTLPVFVFLNIIFRDDPFLALLVFWWLKPLYDRVLLHVYSRSVFGQQVSVTEVVKALPQLLLRTGLLLHLTFYRLDFTRSFRLPIWQLEGLRGSQRGERSKVLSRRSGGYATWLIIVCLHLEAFLQFAVLGLIWMFVPELILESLWQHFWNMVSGDTYPYWFKLSLNAVYFVAVGLVEPMYVAAGFSLYLNRRTLLEGWDLEIAFRRLANRLQQLSKAQVARSFTAILSTVLAAGFFFSSAMHAPEVLADELQSKEPLATQRLQANQAHDVIKQVLADKDFGGEREIERWQLRDFENDSSDEIDADLSWISDLSRALASLIEPLLWIGIITLVVYLVIRISQAINPQPETADADTVVPAVVSGLDIRPESLPEDIPAEARALWLAGKFRDAMSLVYRGTVSALVHRYGIELAESSTEGDVLNAGRKRLKADTGDYLLQITRLWQNMAYAHRKPEETDVLSVLDVWKQHFGVTSMDGQEFQA